MGREVRTHDLGENHSSRLWHRGYAVTANDEPGFAGHGTHRGRHNEDSHPRRRPAHQPRQGPTADPRGPRLKAGNRPPRHSPLRSRCSAPNCSRLHSLVRSRGEGCFAHCPDAHRTTGGPAADRALRSHADRLAPPPRARRGIRLAKRTQSCRPRPAGRSRTCTRFAIDGERRGMQFDDDFLDEDVDLLDGKAMTAIRAFSERSRFAYEYDFVDGSEPHDRRRGPPDAPVRTEARRVRRRGQRVPSRGLWRRWRLRGAAARPG